MATWTSGCRRVAVAIGIALLLGATASAAPAATGRPVVVELFTSQGCSSCPPADEYLGELAKRHDVIALAFHVDYWNYIGWTDPFASQQMTHRQKDYERALNQRYVYTPEMVVDGAAHEVGSDRYRVEKLIDAAKLKAGPGPQVAIARRGDGTIRVAVGAAAPQGAATVWFVTFDRKHTTTVAKGENEGHTLTDYQIVRSLRQIGSWTGKALDIAVDPPAGASADGGCAVLVQRDGTGPIIAAAMLSFAAPS